jgi:hypothetical protein
VPLRSRGFIRPPAARDEAAFPETQQSQKGNMPFMQPAVLDQQATWPSRLVAAGARGVRVRVPREGGHSLSSCRATRLNVMIAVNVSRPAPHSAKRSGIVTQGVPIAEREHWSGFGGLVFPVGKGRVLWATGRWLVFSA